MKITQLRPITCNLTLFFFFSYENYLIGYLAFEYAHYWAFRWPISEPVKVYIWMLPLVSAKCFTH